MSKICKWSEVLSKSKFILIFPILFRNCGNIFCHKCTDFYVPIPHQNLVTPERVCRKCFSLLPKPPYENGFIDERPLAAAASNWALCVSVIFWWTDSDIDGLVDMFPRLWLVGFGRCKWFCYLFVSIQNDKCEWMMKLEELNIYDQMAICFGVYRWFQHRGDLGKVIDKYRAKLLWRLVRCLMYWWKYKLSLV